MYGDVLISFRQSAEFRHGDESRNFVTRQYSASEVNGFLVVKSLVISFSDSFPFNYIEYIVASRIFRGNHRCYC